MTTTRKRPIRVILAEDHTIVREGLRALLERRDDMEVVGEAVDGEEVVQLARSLRPDVVVMDVSMPRLSGVDATRKLRETLPDAHVLILSMHTGEEYVRPAIRAGARGYLLKGSGRGDLVAAVKAVAAGEAFFSPAVAKILLDDARTAPQEPAGHKLTGREREVLKLVAEGHSSPQIARRLELSVKTIEGHRARIMSKLEIRDLAGLVRYAVHIGLVSSDL